jgi:hypothetical protein
MFEESAPPGQRGRRSIDSRGRMPDADPLGTRTKGEREFAIIRRGLGAEGLALDRVVDVSA